MRAGHMLGLYRRYRSGTGIVGLAYGPKEVSGTSRNHECSVAFFVRDKLPLRGTRRRLEDGRRRLPKFVEVEGSDIPTDVVTVNTNVSASPGTRSPPQVYRAGGKISNMQLTGTLGCLASSSVRPGIYAITNQHIGLSEGTAIAFPDFRTIGAIVGTTAASVGLVADEAFLPPFNQPQAYIDVDCALVRIPPNFESRFVADIPRFGKPSAVFAPNLTTPAAFVNSLLGLSVYAYGWPSGPRTGAISHVYYVYSQNSGMEKVATFLVSSSDAGPPGVLGDSGKLWMTKMGGQNVGVGIHSGVVADNPTSSRFAMVTELSSLMRFLRIQLIA
jgi:hypothetical protein